MCLCMPEKFVFVCNPNNAPALILYTGKRMCISNNVYLYVYWTAHNVIWSVLFVVCHPLPNLGFGFVSEFCHPLYTERRKTQPVRKKDGQGNVLKKRIYFYYIFPVWNIVKGWNNKNRIPVAHEIHIHLWMLCNLQCLELL